MVTNLSTDLADRIKEATGENVFLCYHCVKCTSGCPLVDHFDLSPNQIMRAAQLGMEEMVFNSKTPWLCASCQTCTTRCPQGIDIAKVMDFIVSEAMKKGIEPLVPEVALFNKVFLRDVDILGRSYELGLMAELNLRSRGLFKDMDLGLEMFKHRKLKLLPEIVRRRKHKTSIAPRSRPTSEVGYYPGCTLHGMEEEFNSTTLTVLEELNFQPVEPEGWVCCGSTPAHRVDHKISTQLPLESLILYEQEGLNELVLPCASCFSRFRTAARDLRLEPELKKEITQEIQYEYQDSIDIYSLVDFIDQRVGMDRVKESVKRPLEGLKIASYYGCLLTRPPAVTGTDPSVAEYPMAMDRIMKALGATPIDWDYKVCCCGAAHSLTRPDIVYEMSGAILENAKIRGADIVAVACPLCHTNLDGRQTQMDPRPEMPALYFTQLMSLAFGLTNEAALERNLIDPKPILKEKGLL
jgi:heterodisulfide reductase subunit B